MEWVQQRLVFRTLPPISEQSGGICKHIVLSLLRTLWRGVAEAFIFYRKYICWGIDLIDSPF